MNALYEGPLATVYNTAWENHVADALQAADWADLDGGAL